MPVLVASPRIELSTQVVDIGWAYALSLKDEGDYILVRKSPLGPEMAKGVALAILDMLTENTKL